MTPVAIAASDRLLACYNDDMETMIDEQYGTGLCVQCGYLQDNVEPDAVHYECHECGENCVMGLLEIFLWYV